jgi:NADH-quinone oxidoreductase subunit M
LMDYVVRLQMIAHGFVVVGLFSSLTSFFRRYETRTIAEMGGIRTQSPRFALILTFSISFSCSSLLSTLLESLRSYTASQINVWFAF